MSETRLALPQRSPRPFSVPCTMRAPARTAARLLATAFSVSLWAWMPSRAPGMVRATSADDALDLVRQACRRWCRRAPPSARRPPTRPWRRRARSRDWPCSRRRNARRRTAPRASCAARHGDAVADHGEVLLEAAAERDVDMEVPGLADHADRGRRRIDQRRQAGIVGDAAAGPPRHAEGGEARALEARRIARRTRRRSGWRRASRPRHSRCRCGPARARWSPCRGRRNRRPAPARRRAAWCRTDRGGLPTRAASLRTLGNAAPFCTFRQGGVNLRGQSLLILRDSPCRAPQDAEDRSWYEILTLRRLRPRGRLEG